jgi:hypothetical protein
MEELNVFKYLNFKFLKFCEINNCLFLLIKNLRIDQIIRKEKKYNIKLFSWDF